jgi:hypothetical protein
VVLLAGVLRSVVSAWVFPVTPLGDELYYTETAIRIARGEGHVFGAHGMKARWPPGQAYLLSLAVDSELVANHPALLVEMSKSRPDEMLPHHQRFLAPLVTLQVLLGTALVGLAAALGWLLFERSARSTRSWRNTRRSFAPPSRCTSRPAAGSQRTTPHRSS